jgi:hypothetical protein
MTFLLLNLALAFYLVGCVWAHEVDIFRSWRLLDAEAFHRVQSAHWRKLPYWIFAPLGVALAGSIALALYHPPDSPAWAIWGNVGCLALSFVLTALTWGPWQARLSKDPLGSGSPYLAKNPPHPLDTNFAHQRVRIHAVDVGDLADEMIEQVPSLQFPCCTCSGLLAMAHRVNSLARSNRVAAGAKRTYLRASRHQVYE